MKTLCTLLLLLCVNSIGYSQNHKPLLEGNQHNHSITLNKTKVINLRNPIKFKKPNSKNQDLQNQHIIIIIIKYLKTKKTKEKKVIHGKIHFLNSFSC